MASTSIIDKISDSFSNWIGSTGSLIAHTLFFAFSFACHWLLGWSFDFILLVLTTIVSLEAIYLAIFIQRSVNQQAVRLEDVEDALDEVEESIDDVEEALDEVEEGLEDVEEGLEDVEKSIHDAEHPEHTKKTGKSADPQTLALKELQATVKELKAALKELKP